MQSRKVFVRFVAAIVFAGAVASVATAEPFEQKAFAGLLAAIQSRSRADFVNLGDDQFHAMPAEEFERLAEKFAPMLKAGYRIEYFGVFREGNVRIHYWRIHFAEDPDDWLAKLGVENGKVKGLLIKRP